MLRRMLGLLFLTLLSSWACSVTVPCPIHSESVGSLVGTRYVDGSLVGVYHCPLGHNFVAECD